MKEGERVERRNSSKILSDGYKCACGATYETVPQRKRLMLKFVQTAILSSQESRSL